MNAIKIWKNNILNLKEIRKNTNSKRELNAAKRLSKTSFKKALLFQNKKTAPSLLYSIIKSYNIIIENEEYLNDCDEVFDFTLSDKIDNLELDDKFYFNKNNYKENLIRFFTELNFGEETRSLIDNKKVKIKFTKNYLSDSQYLNNKIIVRENEESFHPYDIINHEFAHCLEENLSRIEPDNINKETFSQFCSLLSIYKMKKHRTYLFNEMNDSIYNDCICLQINNYFLNCLFALDFDINESIKLTSEKFNTNKENTIDYITVFEDEIFKYIVSYKNACILFQSYLKKPESTLSFIKEMIINQDYQDLNKGFKKKLKFQ